MQLFLSYSSADRTSVMAVQKLLQARGISTFLDRDNLVSGLAWPQALEQALRAVAAVAVFIGRELGGWQKREMWFALDRQVREEKEDRPFPVIPVLLQGADLTPSFLFINTWIDLRHGIEEVFTAEALDAFEQAIKATMPVRHYEDSAVRVVEYPATAICPYRGLQIFREEDAAFFAGRKAFAKQLLDFTLGKNLVAVVGASGSGKSSVVQAGLIPLLRREQPPANTWDVVSFTPGDEPFHRLASALIPLLEPDMSETARLGEAQELGRKLAAAEIRLEAVLNRVIQKSNGTGRLLLVADQFEELFTNTPEVGRLPFANALLRARGRAPVTILITLRADFYSQIIALGRELSDVLARAQVNIGALTSDELWESITAPARLVGLEFEEGLVDRILTDVGTEPGRLPLVEFALTEIWQRREGRRLTNQAYGEIKGVNGALARRAEAEFARLNPEEQTGVRRLFSRLVRVARPEEAGEDTRQRTELSEADTLAKRVAKRLADARLLVTGSGAGTGTISVEVAHEVLIRNWERLRGWLNEDREFLLWRQRLSGLLAEWERAQESNEALLRGPLLIEAQKWFDERSHDLSDQERKFISASREERERLAQEEKERQEREIEFVRKLAEEQKQRAELSEQREKEQKEAAKKLRRRAIGAAGTAAAAMIFLVISILSWLGAQEQARIAGSRRLAAESSSALTKYPQRSLLLAVEALKAIEPLHRVRVAAAEQSLREALGVIGGRLAARAEAPITTLAISADSRWVVTGSGDHTARLWDLSAKDPAANPVVLRGHDGVVSAVAISADSRWVVTGSWDKTARLWDLKAKDPAAKPVVLRGHEDRVNAVAISADNRWVVTGSEDNTARLWDLSAKDPPPNAVVLRGHDGGVNAVAISADSHWIVTGGSWDKTARLWDLRAKDLAANPVVLRGHDGYVKAVAISPDSRWLVTGSYDHTARLWDLRAKDLAANPVVLRGHDGEVNAVAISADSCWVVTGSGDHTARLWDLRAKDLAANPVVLRGHDGEVNAVAISADSRWLVTGSGDHTARLWDLSAKEPAAILVVLRGHDRGVNAVAISPDNRWVVTGSYDSTARLWDLRAKDPAANPVVLRGHDGLVRAVAISADSRWLVTGSNDNTARLWDLRAQDPVANPVVLHGHEDFIEAVAISADSRWVATGSLDKTARLWDLRAKDPAANPVVLRSHEDRVNAVAISADNRWLVTGSEDNTARLWDLRAQDPAANPVVLRGHDRGVNAVAISADSRWLVTGSWDGTARLWDLRAKDPAANPVVLRGHDGFVRAVAISADSRWVVTGSWDRTARLWDLRAKDLAANPVVLRGHEWYVNAVAISADSRWVVTGSDDRTARLWDLRAKDPAANPVVLQGHDGYVKAVAISADSRWVVTGSEDNTARLWLLHTAGLWLLQMNDLVDLARTVVGRNFSWNEWRLYFPGVKYRKTFPDLPGPD